MNFFTSKRDLVERVNELQDSKEHLHNKLEDKYGEIVALEKKLSEATELSDKRQGSAVKLKNERDKLKKMVRDQTGADLLVNALKAVGAITDTKKEDHAAIDRQLNGLRNQAAGMQSSPYYGGLQSVLGGVIG